MDSLLRHLICAGFYLASLPLRIIIVLIIGNGSILMGLIADLHRYGCERKTIYKLQCVEAFKAFYYRILIFNDYTNIL